MGVFDDAVAYMRSMGKDPLARFNRLLDQSAAQYDELPWYGQAALSANPITNVPVAMGQMRKYAGAGDLTGMGVTALGAVFSPVKATGILGRGMLRSLSPVGIATNAMDTYYELPEDRKQYLE